MALLREDTYINEDKLKEWKKSHAGYRNNREAQALFWLINEEFKLRATDEFNIYEALYENRVPPKKYVVEWVSKALLKEQMGLKA